MPETTVAAIITRHAHGEVNILLTRRNVEPFKGLWCLPGGHIEKNEPARDAVIREIREETGLDFDAHFVDYADEIIPDYGIHAVVLIFDGTHSGELRAEAHEVAEMGWFSPGKIEALPLAFNHLHLLNTYLAKRPPA